MNHHVGLIKAFTNTCFQRTVNKFIYGKDLELINPVFEYMYVVSRFFTDWRPNILLLSSIFQLAEPAESKAVREKWPYTKVLESLSLFPFTSCFRHFPHIYLGGIMTESSKYIPGLKLSFKKWSTGLWFFFFFFCICR